MAVDDAATTTATTGELAWHARRKTWTHATDEKIALQNARAVEANAWFNERLDDQKHLLGCYDHLIVRRKESNQPIPLKFALVSRWHDLAAQQVKVIVQGWKRDGTWPEGMEAPVSTDPNDF